MRHTLLFIFAFLVIGITSCSNAQKAASLQKRIDDANTQIQNLQGQLSDAQTRLAVAQSDLSRAGDFHLLRSNAKRDEDVANAEKKVQNCQQSIQDIQNKIQQQNTNISNWQSQLQTLQN